jgi:hypothetical protein
MFFAKPASTFFTFPELSFPDVTNTFFGRLRKPMCGVLWDQITDEKLNDIPILRQLQSRRR